MAKVALVQPSMPIDAVRSYSGSIGLSFVYSFLKSQGHEMFYADPNINNKPDTLFERLVAFQPEYVGFSIWGESVQRVPRAMAALREKAPDAVYIIGGPEVTEDPRAVLEKTSADFAVQGDGIPTIQHIIDGELDKPGIAYFREGIFVSKGRAQYNPDNWHVDADTFEPTGRTYPALSAVGCDKSCSFCTREAVFPKIVKRRVEDIVADMSAIASKIKKAEFFSFNNDNFLIYPDTLIKIVEAMEKAGLQQKISFQTSADYVLKAEPQLRQVKERICTATMGIESFLDAQLKRYNKGTTAEQNHQAIELLRSLGIRPGFFLILGDRHSDIDELSEVAGVFAEHPEHFLLLAGCYTYADYSMENVYEGVPEFVHMFNHFFQEVERDNKNIFTRFAENQFMDGTPVPEIRKRDVKTILCEALSVADDFRQEKITEDEALEKMNRAARVMLLLLPHLYCTNHVLDKEF